MRPNRETMMLEISASQAADATAWVTFQKGATACFVLEVLIECLMLHKSN
jgi:hypothetical protein